MYSGFAMASMKLSVDPSDSMDIRIVVLIGKYNCVRKINQPLA